LSCRPDWADDIVRIASERRVDKPCAVVGIDIAAGEDHFDEVLHFVYSVANELILKIRSSLINIPPNTE